MKKNCLKKIELIWLMFFFMLIIPNTVFADEVKTNGNNSVDTNWTKVVNMYDSRCGFQTEVIKNKVYTIGRSNGKNSLSTVEVYTQIQINGQK